MEGPNRFQCHLLCQQPERFKRERINVGARDFCHTTEPTHLFGFNKIMVDVQNQQLWKHYGHAELDIAIGKDNFDKVCPVNYAAVIHEREMI